MKKQLVRTLSLMLTLVAVATASFASAAIFFENKASAQLFVGRIEPLGASVEEEPRISICRGGETIKDAAFPILKDARQDGETTWVGSDGNRALAAPRFSLSCDAECVTGVGMRLEVTGDTSAARAMRFGVNIEHHYQGRLTRSEAAVYTLNGDNATQVIQIGDMLQGEYVDVYVSVWFMGDVTTYQGGDIAVDAVFSYPEQN